MTLKNDWVTGDQFPATAANAVANEVALKAPLASPAFTGTPTGITKAHVGLGNVDNTSDAAKPVSTAQQTALDLKASALPTITLTRDAAGQFASATVDGTVETYTRDSTGRIVTITRGAVTRTVTRDSTGRIRGVA